MTLELHDYQRLGARFLQNNPRAGLFMDMGLGKTATTLSALTEEHLPALVVAPKRVAENVWDEEVEIWRPDLSVGVAAGTPDKRAAVIKSRPDLTVIGRDNVADVLDYRKGYQTVILDELSGYKNQMAQRFKGARRLSMNLRRPLVDGRRTRVTELTTPHVWGLTGTPAPNGLLDLWAQVFLLDGGERLGTTLGGYRNRYFYPAAQLDNGQVIEWAPREEAEANIFSALEDLALAMQTDGRIDLPPVTYNTVEVPLTPKVAALYKKFKADLIVGLELLGGEIHTAANAAVLTSKLSQLAAGMLYVDDADLRGGAYDIVHWEKIRALEEIVEGTGSPILVFYRFQAELDMIREALGNRVHTPDEDRIVRRWNAGEIPVLAAHPASIGHGLNLQRGPGHTIVWTSLTWSLEEWQQGNKRLIRQGQQQPVVVHVLSSPKTVDTNIYRRLEGKADVQGALMSHLESPL